MAKNIIPDDEDIIDLTELIETGDKGAGKAVAAYAKAAATPPLPEEDDFATALADAVGPGPGDEDSLDMSGMGGIDDLLDSLDIPAQPREAAASASSGPAPAPEELDNVLDDLLGAPPGAPTQTPPKTATPKAAPADDLDDIFASFESAGESGGSDAAPGQTVDHSIDLEADIDDIFADMESPQSAPKGSPADDLEDLLAPPAPAEDTHKSAKGGPLDDDLDALLGHQPASESAAPSGDPLADDLDALLGGDTPPAPSKGAQPKPSAPGDDLDSLLAEPPAAPKKTAPGPAAPSPAPDLGDELDALLAEAEPSTARASAPERTADLDDPFEAAAPPKASPPRGAGGGEAPEMPPDLLDDLVQSVPADKSQTPQGGQPPLDDPQLATELDAMLESEPKRGGEAVELTPARVPAPVSSELVAGYCQNAPGSHETWEALRGFSRELGAQTAHMQDVLAQVSQLSKRLLACESKLAASRARIAALEKGLEAAMAQSDILREGTPIHSGFMAMIATAVTNALQGVTHSSASTAAKASDASRAMQQVTAQIATIEARLTALESKDHGGSPSPQIQEDLEKMDATLWSAETRIDALEQKMAAVGEHADQPNVQDELEKLDANLWNVDNRLETLEQKLATLEAAGSKAMERAAAATVAKVLQEEIQRLAQS